MDDKNLPEASADDLIKNLIENSADENENSLQENSADSDIEIDVDSVSIELAGNSQIAADGEDSDVGESDDSDDEKELSFLNYPDDDEEEPEANEETVIPQTPVIKRVFHGIKHFCEKSCINTMLFVRVFAVYFFVSGINLCSLTSADTRGESITNWKVFVDKTKFGELLFYMAFVFVFLTLLQYLLSKIKVKFVDPLALLIGLLTFSISLLYKNDNFYLCTVLILVCSVFILYLLKQIKSRNAEKLPQWIAFIIVFGLAIGVCVFVSITSVAHHRVFGTSTFDFGIFVQMFHSMSTDFTAVTTCERDEFLSHFFVHASYIYYLLTPVYAFIPSETTLLVSQAVLAMGGIIPLYLIAKNHKYKGASLVAVCMMYIFSIAIIAPCYYDFHENSFLPTLLMWLLYAVDKRKITLMYIMSVLTCIVKEDAPLYVICIMMFFIVDEKSLKRINGIVIAALSATYFVIITNWLTKNGDGQMMAATRFGNLTINADDGFVGIIYNVLSNPAYFFSQCLNENTMLFFLKMLIPVLFIPFMTKKIHRFWMIIPFIIMNLVVGSGYPYAAEIGYQYTFGPGVLLVYMAVINAADMGLNRKNGFVSCAAVASLLMSVSSLSGKITYYDNYKDKEQHYIDMEETLDSIPEDASVVANTWFLPHVANRDEVYLLDLYDLVPDAVDPNIYTALKYPDRYDFYVMSYGDSNTSIFIPLLEAQGYTLYKELSSYIVIYESPIYAAEHING